LVATDVLSEGQNLQDSGILVNYDLHWNPVRMIQRNGRVNRLGTKYDEVNIYNMRPERKLDSYLKLVQRLQGKIDMIRNTIGTDTPVLDEPENAIEYGDAIKDIYDSDELIRIKALEDAEKAADFLLAEDDYVLDLLKFHAINKENVEYREHIYAIPKGKWAVIPKGKNQTTESSRLFGLVELTLEPSGVSHQFVSVDESDMSIRALSTLQALEWLKTTAKDNERKVDNIQKDRVGISNLISSSAKVYQNKAAPGAPIGQERDVLLLLHDLQFESETINFVRLAFKTNDLYYRKQIDTLKRKIMAAKRLGDQYNTFLDELITLAKKIESETDKKVDTTVVSSKTSLIYVKEK
jgi:superfamily II DNA/RNA helicase